MNGEIGLNIIGDRGLSNDNIALYNRQLAPHTNVVINNNKLAAMLLAQGTEVIYRHKSDQPNGNDDDAHLRYDPIEFVDKRNLEAPPGAVISLTNEPGVGEIFKLRDWTMAAMRHCDSIGRKACILNFATGNPEERHWDILDGVLTYSQERGHIVGHHDYFDLTMKRSMKYHVFRSLSIAAAYGGKWAITELGCAVGYHPERGWQGVISQEAYANEISQIAEFYWLFDIPVCVYSYGPWFNFGIETADVIKTRLAEKNAVLQITKTLNATTATRVNVRYDSTVLSSIKTTLPSMSKITVSKTSIKGGDYYEGSVRRNDWYELYSPTRGFVAGAYVRF